MEGRINLTFRRIVGDRRRGEEQKEASIFLAQRP